MTYRFAAGVGKKPCRNASAMHPARPGQAVARADVAAIATELAEARQAHDTVLADLTAERQAHAANQARPEAGRTELEAAR
ncbi:hypothetical protein [Cupriavidus necator]